MKQPRGEALSCGFLFVVQTNIMGAIVISTLYNRTPMRKHIEEVEKRQLEEWRRRDELKEKEAKQMAEAIAKENRGRRFEIFKIFVTIAATLIVEHFGEILNIVKDLLQSFHLP